MTGATYPAARVVAAKVESHFAEHLKAPLKGSEESVLPDAETIAAVVDAAFWASLRREEGYIPKISIALLPPTRAVHPLTFERPFPLNPDTLTRLAPAVERPGIHLGVWRMPELVVWGTTRSIPPFCFVLEAATPGLLVIKHRRGEDSGKFLNIAVIEGDQIKVLRHDAASLSDCPGVVRSLLGSESPTAPHDSSSLLTQLAVSMRAHGRGGSLLMVPARSDEWRESIMRPILYAVSPPLCELGDLMREAAEERWQRRWQDAATRAVDFVAGLTGVDGATIITDEYDLLAFGAKIGRREGHQRVEQVRMTEPVEGGVVSIVHPAEIGGTRHISAAQFAQDQHDAVSLVASQDGRFTVFVWSTCEQMVEAHRVEVLLL